MAQPSVYFSLRKWNRWINTANRCFREKRQVLRERWARASLSPPLFWGLLICMYEICSIYPFLMNPPHVNFSSFWMSWWVYSARYHKFPPEVPILFKNITEEITSPHKQLHIVHTTLNIALPFQRKTSQSEAKPSSFHKHKFHGPKRHQYSKSFSNMFIKDITIPIVVEK